jgi:CBS domain-containing protein
MPTHPRAPAALPVPAEADPTSKPQRGAEDDARLHLLSLPLRSLLRRPPVTAAPQLSIREAAALMREQRVSSLLLVQDGQLVGLVTDRDLRNRVLAAGLDPSRPLSDIATPHPHALRASAPGFEALLLMARHQIHHVPVIDDGDDGEGRRPLGMVTATDVNEQHSTSAVFLAGDVARQTDLAGLVACAARVRPLQQQLAAAGASAYNTGHIVTAITDALTCRLLALGEARLGPPPLPYAWVAAGSQARHEQTARSDQDNALVLDDRYNAAAHGAYFEQLARWVCDGLDACGYVHCPGDIMAMTDRWRQPQRVWAEQFRRWVETPEPMALMHSCVFFDVRTVAGDPALLSGLRQGVLQRTRGNSLFLAHMVGNALQRQPPLGLFGGLSPQRSGEHKGTLDLKHLGIVPIVDLARIYALAAGHAAVNTHDRLEHAADSGEISPAGVRDLRDALEHLSLVRLRHQSRQMHAGQTADNHLDPDELSNFERSQLKDAFGVVKGLQQVLAQRYGGQR